MNQKQYEKGKKILAEKSLEEMLKTIAPFVEKWPFKIYITKWELPLTAYGHRYTTYKTKEIK